MLIRDRLNKGNNDRDKDLVLPTTTEDPSKTRTRRRIFRPRKRTVLALVGSFVCIYALVRLYYNVELRIKDPYLQAKLYMPLRYLTVRYFGDKPSSRQLKTFRMTSSNSYVINLDQDEKRMAYFQQINKNLTLQRFAAHRWETLEISSNNKEHQDSIAARYPYVRYAARHGLYGDAGCTLSHVHLLQKFLEDSEKEESDYVFIFEDDAKIQEPLLSTRLIEGPADADALFLVPTATKLVKVGSSKNNATEAIRVIQGYGAYGYLITKQGARHLLSHLQKARVPIDVALAGGAFSLKVYIPKHWPVVQHWSFQSSRKIVNAQ